MSELVASSVRRPLSGWARRAAFMLFVYTLSGAFLQVIKISGGLGPVVPVAILAACAAATGVAILVTGNRQLALVAAGLMVVALIGTTPHDIDNLSPANGIGQRIYGVADLAVIGLAFVACVVAWTRWTAVGGRGR